MQVDVATATPASAVKFGAGWQFWPQPPAQGGASPNVRMVTWDELPQPSPAPVEGLEPSPAAPRAIDTWAPEKVPLIGFTAAGREYGRAAGVPPPAYFGLLVAPRVTFPLLADEREVERIHWRALDGSAVNVDDLMACPDIDGALVGGASLKADAFSRIIAHKQA